MNQTIRQGLALACLLLPLQAMAQTPANMAALKGLATVTALPSTAQGRAALASNLAATGGIQTGAIRQPTLLPFAEQQQLALRDAFITDGNYTRLADGLGTTLVAAYQARADHLDRERYTNVSDAVADLIAYANATSGSDSNAGKYFFANMTTNGKNPVSAEAADLLKSIGGIGDVFGVSYGRPAGSPGADAYGNSRPFQTEPTVLPIVGPTISTSRPTITSITADSATWSPTPPTTPSPRPMGFPSCIRKWSARSRMSARSRPMPDIC